MLKYKTFLVFVLTAFCIAGGIAPFSASALTDSPSPWAADTVSQAAQKDLIPQDLNGSSYRQDITRSDFSRLALSLYAHLTGDTPTAPAASYFSDTDDAAVSAAYELQLMSGRVNGIFSPADPITRQEVAVAITKTLAASGIDTSMPADDILGELKPFSDLCDMAGWATQSFAFTLENKILYGMSETELCPTRLTTVEQAVVIASRCLDKYTLPPMATPSPSATPTPDASEARRVSISGDASLVSTGDRSAVVSWKAMPKASTYRVDIYLDQSNFWFADDDQFVKSVYTAANTMAGLQNLRAGMTYRLLINGLDAAQNPVCTYGAVLKITPPQTQQQKEQAVFSDGDITQKEQADALMQSVTVNVWKIGRDGSKYASKATIVVHKQIADPVRNIFKEIFEGTEKFPIKDAGGYNWREPMASGRLSHHNYGTAIDINADENYCIYKDGSTVGKFWLPGQNPYSILPDGEVVSIFAKYGFVWGGDSWSNPNDYMHFSYLGL